ncbi:MAG: toxic anion resistance protein, partial [Erysipelotrichaceae bacterium]|nr:toxic anion resistance protein [Erysipelotrichaceae bacterium]
MLSEEEKKMVAEFAKQIDVMNTAQVLQYGAGAQAKVAGFSEKALDNVKTKDLGEVGGLISSAVTELKGFDVEEEQKGLFGRIKKKANDLTAMKAKYAKAETNINKIVDSLEKHQVTLMKDTATLDQLYQLNLTYYKELTMYILAGKQKLKELEEVTIPALREQAAKTGQPEDAQKVNDMVEQANRFDKKIHDLELTRTISLQMAPQIRLVQNNDVMNTAQVLQYGAGAQAKV